MDRNNIVIVLVSILCFLLSKPSEATANRPDSDSSLNLSKEQLSNLVKKLLSDKSSAESETCKNDFTQEIGVIIRTRESLDNGAKFLVATPGLKSDQECREECCKFKNTSDANARCDFAVYQGIGETQCFMFDCVNEMNKGDKFLCVFSKHVGYTAYKRTLVSPDEKELRDIAIEKNEISTTKSTTTAATITTTIPTTTTTSPTTTSLVTTSEFVTSPTSTIQTSHVALPATAKGDACLKSCDGKFRWKCDDGCCISLFNVCNGVAQCSDKSDEGDCPDSQNQEPKDTPVSTLSTLKTSLTKIISTTTSSPETRTIIFSPTSSLIKGVEVNVHETIIKEDIPVVHPEKGALLPLALGLVVTLCVLVMVACRLRVMKRKLTKRRPLLMDDSDYLINGMYL